MREQDLVKARGVERGCATVNNMGKDNLRDQKKVKAPCQVLYWVCGSSCARHPLHTPDVISEAPVCSSARQSSKMNWLLSTILTDALKNHPFTHYILVSSVIVLVYMCDTWGDKSQFPFSP